MGMTDAGNVLATIDSALADYEVSGDAMRWAPPTSSATFTWDEEAETGSGMFTGVDTMALEGLSAGSRVWVDGRPYIVVSKVETAERGFMFELAPE